MARWIYACLLLSFSAVSWADEYLIDDTHTFVEWRVQHLGYSWLYGRFNDIRGRFVWDEQSPEDSVIEVEIQTGSLDSNHALRDKHLKGQKYLETKAFPVATFKSTSYKGDANVGTVEGELTLHGVTRRISFDVQRLGQGNDPWGGYRVGFIGRITLDRRDFGIMENIGPSSWLVELDLGIEGIRQNKPLRLKK
ncbi:MAG: YceI family protein [bacterium]